MSWLRYWSNLYFTSSDTIWGISAVIPSELTSDYWGYDKLPSPNVSAGQSWIRPYWISREGSEYLADHEYPFNFYFADGSASFTLTITLRPGISSTYMYRRLTMSNLNATYDSGEVLDGDITCPFTLVTDAGDYDKKQLVVSCGSESSTSYNYVLVTITDQGTFPGPRWTFSNTLPQDRIARLLNPRAPDLLIQQLAGFAPESYTVGVSEKFETSCIRPEFRISVKSDFFDYFFNSPYGYRAQFVVDAEAGNTYNRSCISGISSFLIQNFASQIAANSSQLTNEEVSKCLGFSQAKIWIDVLSSEPDVTSPYFCSNQAIDIMYEPWEKNMNIPSASGDCKGVMGVKAYLPDAGSPDRGFFVINGGWMTVDGRQEFINPGKENRAQEIQTYGFT